MSDTQQLVARIDAFAKRTKRKPSTLSRLLFGNGKRIDEIRAGGSMTMATYQRAVSALDRMEATPSKVASS